MTFKFFYTDYKKDQHIKSDEAKSASVTEIVDYINTIMHEPDNFIGLIDDNEALLQFMAEDNGMICLDAPIQDRKGSFTKNASLGDCIKIIETLSQPFEIDKIEGLKFKNWG